ncbi:MAG: hypothetical protein AB2L24_24070 [Mangrovibacterium sp.]
MSRSIYIIIAILLFWAGFVSSISFMEAWLKFRADGVTLDIGLSIGKKIFTTLNRIEWVLLFLYTSFIFSQLKFRFEARVFISLLILLILFLQTFFLLPQLSRRVDLILEGKALEKSFLHLYFGSLEIIKVGLLIWLSFRWYKSAFHHRKCE